MLFKILGIVLVLAIIITLSACSLKRLMPKGSVLSTKERAAQYGKITLPKVNYTEGAKVDFPIIPIQVWGVTYDLDIVLVSNHPDWNMHEYARVAMPNGLEPLWVMKDAREGSLDQFLIGDVPDIQSWLPEIPVVRKQYPIKVTDRSTSDWLDLDFEYENMDKELVRASYKGKPIHTKMKKRNGSTMGHSKNQLIAVLDLPYRDMGKRASIEYGGKAYKIKKILGLVPFQMALTQTQAGLSIGHFTLEKSGEQLKSTHLKKQLVEQAWDLEHGENAIKLSQENELRTLEYVFDTRRGFELTEALVKAWDTKDYTFRIKFNPAIPDLRKPFKDTVVCNFVMDVNGQENHATGQVRCYWEGEKAILETVPQAPWWVADRPMKTVFQYTNQKAEIEIMRKGV